MVSNTRDLSDSNYLTLYALKSKHFLEEIFGFISYEVIKLGKIPRKVALKKLKTIETFET